MDKERLKKIIEGLPKAMEYFRGLNRPKHSYPRLKDPEHKVIYDGNTSGLYDEADFETFARNLKGAEVSTRKVDCPSLKCYIKPKSISVKFSDGSNISYTPYNRVLNPNDADSPRNLYVKVSITAEKEKIGDIEKIILEGVKKHKTILEEMKDNFGFKKN